MNQSSNPLLAVLLYPFSILYGLIIWLRNLLFDAGFLPSREFPLPVICVGNITAGGTGKTPHVEYLVSFLRDKVRVAVLSRGYKRKTSGFIIAEPGAVSEVTGDEPLQIKRKFPDIDVAVSENRVKGINMLCRYNEAIQTIILDDAFQHRWVKPGISVLLVDYNRPLHRDLLLPAGRLREGVAAIRRAAIIVVTKCPPGLSPIERRIFSRDLNLLPWQALYFTTLEYGEPLPVFDNGEDFPGREENESGNDTTILMVTGIATPGIFKRHLLSISTRIEEMNFPDHHNFRERDIKRIEKKWHSLSPGKKVLMTTEKDAIRLGNFPDMDASMKSWMYYVPVVVKFLEGGDKFENQIFSYVRNNKRNHILS